MSESLGIDKSQLEIRNVDDEIRADAICVEVLKKFHQYLLDKKIPPEQASSLASGADYFTRDFVISRKQQNFLDEQAGIVHHFAGNWYIISTLQPDIHELSRHLEGVKSFYRFLNEGGFISRDFLQIVEHECDNIEYYRERIEKFWEIEGDGYFAWEKECTLNQS